MKKKHIVIEFITSMGEGGAQSLVKDYVLHLDHNCFVGTIFCLFPMLDSGPGQLVKKNNIRIVSVYPKYSKFWSLVNKIGGRKIVSKKLKKEIDLIHPDVIHAHLGVLQYLIPIKSYIPKLFYTCHSEPMKNFGSKESSEFKAASELIRDSGMQLIALHDEMRIELNDLFGVNDTEVIYNGIDINRFYFVKEKKEDIRRSLSIKEDVFLVGHVGRFDEAKNHEFLIDVFCEVKNKLPNSKLLLVGTGPLKERIIQKVEEKGLKEHVLFLEQRKDVERLLKAMDSFLFPSIYEGLPVSLIEAQVSGLHCVASDRITKEAFLTPKMEVLSLNQTAIEWAEAVLDINYRGVYNQDIYTFDMKKDILALEKKYEG